VTPWQTSVPPLVLHTRCVTGTGGGPEKTILNSPRFLRPLGYECVCAYMHPPRDGGFQTLQKRAEMAGASLVGIPDKGPLDFGVLRQMIRLCRHHQVAVWHGHDYKSNALGLVVRWFWPMKLVTTVHGWGQHGPRTPLYYSIDKFCLKGYEEVICVSKDLYEECLRLGVSASRCHWIHNAIDTEEYSRRQPPPVARQLFPPLTGARLIGAVGRLSAEKGFDLLIRAVDRLLREGRDVCLWIAGEGEERPKLQALIAELGREDRIRLLGHVPDPKPFFESLDLFVLSSVREGLPNVVLEAMAMEVPVVATRIAGVPTLVEEGHSGLIVDPGSVEGLVQGIERLIDDPQLRDSVRQAARARVVSKFSFAQRMQKIVEIYNEVLGRC
jgi:glycosyltransferase involved in cell wall biosynthesis